MGGARNELSGGAGRSQSPGGAGILLARWLSERPAWPCHLGFGMSLPTSRLPCQVVAPSRLALALADMFGDSALNVADLLALLADRG